MGESAAIHLAGEPSFALGDLAVEPASRTLRHGGRSAAVEPRNMQVLVLLARHAGEVVGRQALIDACWEGRIVGEDAVNRAVQKLRRALDEVGGGVAIETIPRVGYRLNRPPTVPDAARAAPAGTRRTLVGLAAAIAILLVVLAWRVLAMHDLLAPAWRIAGSRALDDLPPAVSDAVLSPDARHLAYRAPDADGHDRIFVRAAVDGAGGGGVGTPVSPAKIDARRPAWSPDGAGLAFAAYDADRPCRLYIVRLGRPATPVGTCETVRDPRLAWSADGRSLLFGDAPGENAVQRITGLRLADGRRTVLSSPPGESMGDALPSPRGRDIVFQRQFGWADEGWIAREMTTGRERVLWRRRGVAGSVAAPLPDGTLAIAWTLAGASGLDFVGASGGTRSQPLEMGQVTAISVARERLLAETNRAESAVARAGEPGAAAEPLATVRGRISGPALLPDGALRLPVASAGVARIWERGRGGALRPWGAFIAARISGLAPSPDGRLMAALVTADAGREIVLFDFGGRPIYRWNPHARSLNPAAWSGDGRHLIVPALDGAGWRLFELDPFGKAPPRDLGRPGFAVVQSRGPALYAVRAGETTGLRELWRIDGQVRRLPIDLTLFDIVNWCAVDDGIWLPDRSDRAHPRLILRDAETGRVLRDVAAPGLAGAGSGMAADARGPVYVKTARDAPEFSLLTLVKSGPRLP